MAILQGLVVARPDDPRIYEGFGIIHREQKQSTEATVCFEAALDLDKHSIIAHWNLGEIAYGDGDLDAARRHMLVVLEDDVNGPMGAKARGFLRQIRNRNGG